MIPQLIRRFDAARPALLERFARSFPGSYGEIVRAVVEAVTDDDGDGEMALDPERITCVDHGHYQGTQLFLIARKGGQPSDYWYVKVGYGSCSGCDALAALSEYADQPEKQAAGVLTEALHVAQNIKAMQ